MLGAENPGSERKSAPPPTCASTRAKIGVGVGVSVAVGLKVKVGVIVWEESQLAVRELGEPERVSLSGSGRV